MSSHIYNSKVKQKELTNRLLAPEVEKENKRNGVLGTLCGSQEIHTENEANPLAPFTP